MSFYNDMGLAAKVLGFPNAHIAYDIVRNTPSSELPFVLSMLVMDPVELPPLGGDVSGLVQ